MDGRSRRDEAEPSGWPLVVRRRLYSGSASPVQEVRRADFGPEAACESTAQYHGPRVRFAVRTARCSLMQRVHTRRRWQRPPTMPPTTYAGSPYLRRTTPGASNAFAGQRRLSSATRSPKRSHARATAQAVCLSTLLGSAARTPKGFRTAEWYPTVAPSNQRVRAYPVQQHYTTQFTSRLPTQLAHVRIGLIDGRARSGHACRPSSADASAGGGAGSGAQSGLRASEARTNTTFPSCLTVVAQCRTNSASRRSPPPCRPTALSLPPTGDRLFAQLCPINRHLVAIRQSSWDERVTR